MTRKKPKRRTWWVIEKSDGSFVGDFTLGSPVLFQNRVDLEHTEWLRRGDKTVEVYLQKVAKVKP